MEGRAVGTAGNARARAYLLERMVESDIERIGDSYEYPFAFGDGASGVNLIGRIEGRTGRTTIVLTAHYDHVGIREGEIYNGADDNASGTAAALEIGRIVAAEPLESTLIVALLDAEEAGLQGARALVAAPPVPLEGGTLNVNLDMVARSGGVLWAAGAYHQPELRPVLERVAETAPVTLRLGHDRPDAPEGDDWTGASDHGPFHDAGIPFVYFGVEDHPDYHRPTDDPEQVDTGELLASVQTILMALRALDAAMPIGDARPGAQP
jgi:Zn-dependent M28 family amino/carboxypeptidase